MRNGQLPSRPKRILGYTVVLITAVYPLHPAWASISVADNNTQIIQPNNIPIINIATPNGAGVSHNRFQDFSVQQQGAVLNNAIDATQSQIAGRISANPHLTDKPAALIINEVVGNRRSQLQGKLEVAGTQANVVIANPQGITCDGCSFVNTPGITLTTGTPILDEQGALSAIEVKKGSVVIAGQGMNAEAQTYADIISRATELNGKIKADNLTLMQGTNRVDFNAGTVTPIDGVGAKPTISVDTKALGGMYANQVKLVSTEAGVGVNLTNIQTNQQDLTLTVDGKITLDGAIQAKKDLNVSSKSLHITPNAKLHAADDITLATPLLTNQGQVIAGKDMRLFVEKLKNQGEKALIQATDNLWIQKNAQGELSTLIENQSATIKTEKGDLIIKTEKLINQSTTPLFEEVKQQPDSTDIATVGETVEIYMGYGGLLIMLFPELKDFSGGKWFDILNIKKDGGVNAERTTFKINKNYIPSVINSGKNLFLHTNELINQFAAINAKQNLIATGNNLHAAYYRLGDLNKWDLYSPEYDKFDFSHLLTRDAPIEMGQDIFNDNEFNGYEYHEGKTDFSKFLKEGINNDFNETALDLDEENSDLDFGHMTFIKTGSHYEYVINNNPDYLFKAGKNLVFDFKNSIHLERRFPSSQYEFKKVHHNLFSEEVIKSNNIVLNAENIDISLSLMAENNLSLIAKNNIDIKNSLLFANKAVNLAAENNITFSHSFLKADDIAVIAKYGNIDYSLNPTYVHYLDTLVPPTITATNNATFYAGKEINFTHALINVEKNIELTALGNINIKRDESFIFNLFPKSRDTKLTHELVNRLGHWKSQGEIIFTAGKNIISQGIKYSSDKSITFNAGQNIYLAPKAIDAVDSYFSTLRYPELRSQLSANNNILLNASGNIDLTAANINAENKVVLLAGGDITLGATVYSKIENADEDKQDTQYVTTAITGNKGIAIASSGAFTTQGSTLKSADDITISSGGNIRLEAVKTLFREQSGSDLEEIYKQTGTELSSGKKLTLLSEGSILFQASKLFSETEMDVAAKGGFLYAQAMEESSYYEEEKKRCNRWTLCITKKKVKQTFFNSTNKVTEFISNGDIRLFAKDDITLEASKIATAKNATITSKTGKVHFKAVKNHEFKQVVTDSNGIFITHRDRGYTSDKWALPSLLIGGKLTVDAPNGISADVKAQREESLEQALTVLSNTREYAWLKDLKKHENVNWALVKDTYASWDDTTEQLNPVVGAIIAIAVAVATYGTAAAATIGGLASSAATTAGASASMAATASVAAQAGFASLASQATVSLVGNKGNVSKTFKELASSDTAKSVVTSMAVAGALQGLDQFMGWDKAAQGAMPSRSKLLLTDSASWNQVAQRVAAHSVVSSTIGTAMQGGRFIDNFQTALLSNIGSQFHAEGANLIGDHGAILGHAGKVLSHGAISGLAAEISGGNVKGAVAGGLAAELAAITLGDNLINAKNWQQKSEAQAQFVRLFGGVAGGVFTGEPGGVYSGAAAAETTFRHNYLSHQQKKLKEAELAAESDDFKKILIQLKWGYISADQNAALIAGGLSGLPAGAYETIEGAISLLKNPQETYNAIRTLLMSDDTLGVMTESVKQSYIARLNKIETEYQRAGVGGAFNAGLESGKLFFEIAGSFAGGIGLVKGGVSVVAKTTAKIAKPNVQTIDINKPVGLAPTGPLNIKSIQPIISQENLLIAANKKVIEEINKLPSKSKAQKIATMVAAYDINTGTIIVKGSVGSSIKKEMLHENTIELLKNKLDGAEIGTKTVFCNNFVGGCAEVLAADELIRNGVKIKNIRFSQAYRPRDAHGFELEEIPSEALIKPCENCTKVFIDK